jgi:creatinine amidohydrolase
LSVLDLLAARVDAIPALLEALLARGLDLPPALRLGGRSYTVTAAGIAEGPAHYLVHLLGARARFVPLSTFALGGEAVGGDVLVVYSQGLSPNARIALAQTASFRDTLLLTSTEGPLTEALRARGVHVVLLEPRAPEAGLLLRVAGPAVARGAAALLAQAVDAAEGRPTHDLAPVPAAVREARVRAEALVATLERARLLDPLVLVVPGPELTWCRALAWKWMEGLWTPEPPCWDVLQFAHGPLQSIHGKPTTILTLEHDGARPLFERLEQVLDHEHHIRLCSHAQLPGPLGAFEHDMTVNVLLLAALSQLDRALESWPARDADGALYDLDHPLI